MSKDALVAAVPNPGGLDDDRYPSLEAYTGYARQIADHLRQLGYRANDPDQTHNWTARKLDEEIEALIDVEDAEGVRFIHILGDGEPKLRSIQPVGADGATDKRCDLELWLRGLQPSAGARPQAPRTLFVLDTCHSGAAADPAWSGDVPAEDLRGWVLAASARDRSAYNARLSKAVAEALGDIRRNEFGVDPSEQWVPWTLFRDRVRNQVERDQDDIHQQRVTASRTDRDVDLPFLANPRFHPPSHIDRASLAAPDGLGEFLDPEHFTTRASGRPGQAAANTIGAFVGRVEELRNVTRWIDERSSGDAVRVITGSPGTGKSALLGILVCAAHPRLRTTTALIWARASTVPQEQSFVAAVHARALTVSQVTASIALQLGLTTQRDPSEGSAVSQTDLISALAAAETPALIVIDALDECANVAALTELIETLASGQRRSGDPLCHLLIGTRSGEGWHAINRWLSALTPQQIINLDETPRHVLNGELEDYFRSALPSAMTSLARRLADKLVEAQTGRSEWGAFLVASLYSQYLQRRSSEGPTDSTAILTAMPTTLPAVVDLDLRADGDPVLPWELLSCLAWTKGSGAPLHLIQRLLSSAFHIDGEVGLSDTIAALDRVRFYLRSTVDELGQTVYRPFHQSIIDQLRTGDIVTATAVLTGLVAERPVINGIRTWESADPYLKTHVLAHALDADRIVELLADAELLVHAEPEAVIVALAAAGDRARETALVYRATSLEDQDPVARRDLLMLNARRGNQSALAVRLGRPPHGRPTVDTGVGHECTVVPRPGEYDQDRSTRQGTRVRLGRWRPSRGRRGRWLRAPAVRSRYGLTHRCGNGRPRLDHRGDHYDQNR